MSLRNLIFQAEVIEQRFGAVVLPHHDQQTSDDQNPTEHGRMLSSNMLLLNRTMIIIGVDFHPEFQQIALVDKDTGEFQEKRLAHRDEAEKFYRGLAAAGQK